MSPSREVASSRGIPIVSTTRKAFHLAKVSVMGQIPGHKAGLDFGL